jgi:hypothetical protein
MNMYRVVRLHVVHTNSNLCLYVHTDVHEKNTCIDKKFFPFIADIFMGPELFLLQTSHVLLRRMYISVLSTLASAAQSLQYMPWICSRALISGKYL